MERFFILDKFNTWYDWRLILTEKEISEAEPKTNYVSLDGMSGNLDLTEALTGEVTYDDRTITAKFWTDEGSRKDRELLLRKITTALHGKKIKIFEPDDTDHYFYGRVTITPEVNNLAYLEFTLSAVCDPWRYSIDESCRSITVNGQDVKDVVIINNGVNSLSPVITVSGAVDITFDGVVTSLVTGSYKVSDIKLKQGINIVGVSGEGTVTFTYREADL